MAFFNSTVNTLSNYCSQGWTPLHYAVKEGHVDILQDCFADELCHDKTKV